MTPHPPDTSDVRDAQDISRGFAEPPTFPFPADPRIPRPYADGETPAAPTRHPRQPFYYGRGPSYTAAVHWIAVEDEPGALTPHDVLRESGMTVALVADVFGRFDQQVAEDVVRYRRARLDGSASTRNDLG